MSNILVKRIKVLKTTGLLRDPLQFEVTIDCLKLINEDVCFEVVYVGDPCTDDYDQSICQVSVGPVAVGRYSFVIEADPVKIDKLRVNSIFGVTSVIIIGSYKNQQFLRAGYILNVKYPGVDVKELENYGEEEEEFIEEDSETESEYSDNENEGVELQAEEDYGEEGDVISAEEDGLEDEEFSDCENESGDEEYSEELIEDENKSIKEGIENENIEDEIKDGLNNNEKENIKDEIKSTEDENIKDETKNNDCKEAVKFEEESSELSNLKQEKNDQNISTRKNVAEIMRGVEKVTENLNEVFKENISTIPSAEEESMPKNKVFCDNEELKLVINGYVLNKNDIVIEFMEPPLITNFEIDWEEPDFTVVASEEEAKRIKKEVTE